VDGTFFSIVLAVGSNTTINHPYAGAKRRERYEILRVDVDVVFQSCQSDVTHTAVIGAPHHEQRSVYTRLCQVPPQTIAAAQPGDNAENPYALCQHTQESKIVSITSQAVGHGLGIGMHEFSILHAHETAPIKPGMVLTVEPAAKDSQEFIYHLEDLFVVTQSAPKILTTCIDADDIFVIQ